MGLELAVRNEWHAWRELLLSLPDVDCMWAEPLSQHTTFGVGGPVRCLARPKTESAFIDTVQMALAEGIPFGILGGGSNILAPDDPSEILLIHTRPALADTRILASEGEILYSGSGVRVAELLRFCLRRGLGGVECLTGIPGTVGGALVMNAGTAEGCVADVLVGVDVLDDAGKRRFIEKSELPIAYRAMGIPDGWVVLGGELRLHAVSQHTLKGRIRESVKRRKRSQPLEWPSAGCVFRNPPSESAGALIDRAGLKGFRIGDAQVSEKHANWIVNRGRARAVDILALIGRIEKRVFERFGVRLEKEIKVLGREKQT